MRPSAVAASSRALGDGLARVAHDPQERDLGGVDVVGSPAVGQRDGGGDRDARLGIIEVPAQEHRGVFVRDPGERMQRRRANVDVLVLDHALDGRDPATRDRRTERGHHAQRSRAHPRRFVLKEQRRHEVAPVERLEQVDGVEHRAFVRARQLLDERFDRRRVGDFGADGRGRDVARHDAGAERAQVLPPGDERHRHPRRPSRPGWRNSVAANRGRVPGDG